MYIMVALDCEDAPFFCVWPYCMARLQALLNDLLTYLFQLLSRIMLPKINLNSV